MNARLSSPLTASRRRRIPGIRTATCLALALVLVLGRFDSPPSPAQQPPMPGEGLVTSTQLLDANQMLIKDFSFPLAGAPDNKVLARLAALTETRNGAVADGVSLLLVRTQVDGPGQVAFSLDGDEKGGSLWDIEKFTQKDFGTTGEAKVETRVYPVGNKFYAFALYLSPPEFGDKFPATKQSRKFTVKVEYKPKDRPAPTGPPVIDLGGRDCAIELVRPPVVLVH